VEGDGSISLPSLAILRFLHSTVAGLILPHATLNRSAHHDNR
jgi:hypothetical protein